MTTTTPLTIYDRPTWPQVKVAEVPVPLVTDPSDAVIKITSTAICGCVPLSCRTRTMCAVGW